MKDSEYLQAYDTLKMVLHSQPNLFTPVIARDSTGQQLAEMCWAFIRTYQEQYKKEVQ